MTAMLDSSWVDRDPPRRVAGWSRDTPAIGQELHRSRVGLIAHEPIDASRGPTGCA